MTGIFKANNPSNNFFLLLYGLAIKLYLFLQPPGAQLHPSDAPLFSSMVLWLQKLFPQGTLIFSLLAFILIFIQAMLLNKAVNDQRMLSKLNYLPAMAYLLITSLFPEWYAFSSALVANTFLIWVWARLCTMHNNPHAKSGIFNIGLAIGLASFFYYPAIIFTILFIAGIAITRAFRLNEWLIGLIGILTPFYFFGAWLFLSGQWEMYRLPIVLFTVPVFIQSAWDWAALILIALTLMLGFYFVQHHFRRQVVQTRKSWQLLTLYLVVAALVPFVNAKNSFGSWILMAVPISVFAAAAFFYPERKWFGTIIHWGMVAIIVAVAYFVS